MLRLPISILLVVHMIACPLQAQTADRGGKFDAMGGAGVALPDDAWPTLNPAAVAAASSPQLSLHGSQGYGLAELRSAAAAVSWPISRLTGVFVGRTFGFTDYRTTSLHVGAAAKLSDVGGGLFGGLLLGRHTVSIPGYGNASAFTLDAGWILAPLPGLLVGASVTNATGAEWVDGEPLPQTIRAGIAYVPHRAVVALDVGKSLHHAGVGRFGFGYELMEGVWLRGGGTTAPARVSVGAGYQSAAFGFDLTAERHEVLGWTPALSATVRW